MTDRDFEFAWGRWFLWGLVAIIGLGVVIWLFFSWGDDTEEIPDVPKVEWSIEVSEYGPTPGEVTLKGDEPAGFPTETWHEDVLLARTVDARAFEWNMEVSPEVPAPVYEIDQAGSCEELETLLLQWADTAGSAPGDARRTEAGAFAQHALNTMQDQGCEVSAGS